MLSTSRLTTLLGLALALLACGSPAPLPAAAVDAAVDSGLVGASDSAAPSADATATKDAIASQDALGPQPCLQVSPNVLDFGGVIPGNTAELQVKLCNCGPSALAVTGLALAATAISEFSIDQAALYADQQIAGPPPVSASNPLALAPAQCVPVTVGYAPQDITPTGTAPDTATLVIASSAGVMAQILMTGSGVTYTCPTPVVTVNEGQEVIPQTLLHLVGSKSYVPGVANGVKKYLWSTKQPPGSNQPLVPGPDFPNPTLLANTAGEYIFCLEVWDGGGVKGCNPACEMVLVVPNDAVHIELLWDTPADDDQSDKGPGVGADMDLHLAHPMANCDDVDCDGEPDPWFSKPFDAYWFNPMPDWGKPGQSDDDPSIDLDDTDGAGPENLTMHQPEGTVASPVAYSLGVYYQNDHGFGTSYAMVSVFIEGSLAVQTPKVQLAHGDMWYVGKLWWPYSGIGSKKSVFQGCYQAGDSCAAKQNLMWQATGAPCINQAYAKYAVQQYPPMLKCVP